MSKTKTTPAVININEDLSCNNFKIVNISAGVASTDGVNVSQLQAQLQTVVTNTTTQTPSGSAVMTYVTSQLAAIDYSAYQLKSNLVTTLDTSATNYPSCSAVTNAIANKIDTNQKGVANGVPTLDGTGKLPTSQLPSTVLGAMTYIGTVGTGGTVTTLPTASSSNKGNYYVVKTAGTFGGITDCQIGDWVVSNGSIWEKIDNTDQITSVAGLQGVITAASLKTALDVQAISSSSNNGYFKINGTDTNVYTHPATHPASIIQTDANNRFVTDTQIANWNQGSVSSVRTYGKLCTYSNDITATFSEAGTIKANSLVVYRCGLRMLEGAANDYTYTKSGNTVTITFTTPITNIDVIQVDYSI